MTSRAKGVLTVEGFNGWANWQTWNVALWLQNTEPLYRKAKAIQSCVRPYDAFKDEVEGARMEAATPDGVRWDDPALCIEELDEMIREL